MPPDNSEHVGKQLPWHERRWVYNAAVPLLATLLLGCFGLYQGYFASDRESDHPDEVELEPLDNDDALEEDNTDKHGLIIIEDRRGGRETLGREPVPHPETIDAGTESGYEPPEPVADGLSDGQHAIAITDALGRGDLDSAINHADSIEDIINKEREIIRIVNYCIINGNFNVGRNLAINIIDGSTRKSLLQELDLEEHKTH